MIVDSFKGISLYIQSYDMMSVADECLSNVEKERSRKFKYPIHQERFEKRISWVKKVLADQLGLPAYKIHFNYNEFGKPYLSNSKMADFNYSHSGSYVMLAISPEHPIGCDIEQIDRTVDVANICEQFFSPAEVRAFKAYPPQEQHQIFFNLWSRKEAFIKAHGVGLSYGLNNFSVNEGSDLYPHIYESKDQKSYSVYAPEIISGYTTSVVIME